MTAQDEGRVTVRTVVNGQAHELSVAPDRLLLDVLRDDLGLTGTKEGCSVGVCGLCSVLVDGTLLTACLLPVVKVDGRSVTTIEGIAAPDGTPSAVQAAFVRHGGLQCGICTAGQVIAATALLAEEPQPTEQRVRDWMTGNLCRCTGYYGIVASVLAASGREVDDLDMRPPIETMRLADASVGPDDHR